MAWVLPVEFIHIPTYMTRSVREETKIPMGIIRAHNKEGKFKPFHMSIRISVSDQTKKKSKKWKMKCKNNFAG